MSSAALSGRGVASMLANKRLQKDCVNLGCGLSLDVLVSRSRDLIRYRPRLGPIGKRLGLGLVLDRLANMLASASSPADWQTSRSRLGLGPTGKRLGLGQIGKRLGLVLDLGPIGKRVGLRQIGKHLGLVSVSDRLANVSVLDRLANISVSDQLANVSVLDRLANVSVVDRLANISVSDRLAKVSGGLANVSVSASSRID